MGSLTQRNKMKYKIFEANTADLEPLQKYLIQFFNLEIEGISQRPDGITLAEVKEYIPDDSNINDKLCLLAKLDNAIVGNLTLKRNPKFEYRHSGEFGITVFPEHQNKGIGTALISKMEKWAKQNNFIRLELGVWSNNTNAINLYKKLGYSFEGIKKDAIIRFSNVYDLILMVKMIRDIKSGHY